MLTGLDGAGLRLHPEWRTVLSDGAGAAAQLRLGWGAVASRYDAFLAANPNPEVPSDRLNLWIRTRCWLQREGYMREIDAKCADSFTADPAGRFARWRFRVPCGMGLEADFEFTHRLDPAALPDIRLVWGRLHRDPIFNMTAAALNLLSAAEEKTGRIDFPSYSPEELKLIFTRYNGTVPHITPYGEAVYQHYLRYLDD